MKVLFILKLRHDYDSSYGAKGFSSGLQNSATFVSDMLSNNCVDSKIEIVVDGNSIDRVVTQHKPNIAIIEALWVTPEKLKELTKLHPNITWVIRNHSEIPFLANEGIATDWVYQYAQIPGVFVSSNTVRSCENISVFTKQRTVYLPNYYIHKKVDKFELPTVHNDVINIGCFGAIRPLKNQMMQAVAAIDYAERSGEVLHFHINSTRLEQWGAQVYKNLKNLFANNGYHELIEHEWKDHNTFCSLIKSMDVVLAASYTETFCIVAADAVSQGVPVVSSEDIFWLNSLKCNPNDRKSIVRAIIKSQGILKPLYLMKQRNSLEKYLGDSWQQWIEQVRD